MPLSGEGLHPWTEDSEGGFWRSGAIGDGEASWCEAVVEGSGLLSFAWKVSSEEYEGEACDYAACFVDRVEVKRIGGETGWAKESVAIESEGVHTVRWVYVKDEDDVPGAWEDCAWLATVDFLSSVCVGYALGGAAGSAPDDIATWEGENIFLPSSEGFSREDHVFAGWSDGETTYAAGAVYMVPDHSVTLTAQWIAKTFVSFDLGGGAGTVPEVVKELPGARMTLLDNAGFAWANHTFLGWSDGETTYAPGAAFVVPESHVILTAQWAENRLAPPTVTLMNSAGDETTFLTSAWIKLAAEAGTAIYYTLDGSTPSPESLRYEAPFEVVALSVRVRAIAVRENYFDSDISEAAFSSAAARIGLGTSLTFGGDAEWSPVAAGDVAAMRSGAIGEGGVSWMETTLAGEGILAFQWKVSSFKRKGRLTDYVALVVDGDEVAALGGLVDAWQPVEVAITGSGAHTIRWSYRKNSDGYTEGDDCAWLAKVSFGRAGLPELPAEATPDEVQAAVAAFADAAVVEQVKTVETYNAFKAWVGEKNLAPQAVAEAPRAWASYVLGQPALLPEEIPEDTLLVESFEPDASAGDGAYSLTFRLEDATLGEEAVAALLDTVFEVQGGTSLAGDGLSGDAVETTFEVVDGKVRVKVSPKGDTPPGTFFYRIRLK